MGRILLDQRVFVYGNVGRWRVFCVSTHCGNEANGNICVVDTASLVFLVFFVNPKFVFPRRSANNQGPIAWGVFI